MKILILHGSSDLYGASKILLVTVQTFVKNGHQVTVILTESGPLAHLLTEAGAVVLFIRLGILRRKYKSVSGLLNRIAVLRKAYLSICVLIRQQKFDIVYSNTTAVLAGAFAAKRTRTRHIWHIHEIIESPQWLYRFLGRTLNYYSDTVIAVSEAVAKSWSKYVDAKKIRSVYNGIDYSPFLEKKGNFRAEIHAGDDAVVIGMIGRVHPWKGQGYFLDIAAALKSKFANLRFVMAGDAFPGNEYLYTELAEKIASHGLEKDVTDLGYRNDIPALLQGLDILILPSVLPDPFPTVILEAMASGKPVAATAHGGALEMIEDGVSGILIPVHDASAAAGKLELLIKDSNLRRQIGEAARLRVQEEFSRTAFENKMLKVLQ